MLEFVLHSEIEVVLRRAMLFFGQSRWRGHDYATAISTNRDDVTSILFLAGYKHPFSHIQNGYKLVTMNRLTIR